MKRTIVAAVFVVGMWAAPGRARANDASLTTVGVDIGGPSSLGAFVDGAVGLGKTSLLSLRAQAGISGGELGAGLGRGVGVGQSVVVRAVMAHTWGQSRASEAGRTLVGAEVQYGLALNVVSVRAGVLRPLAKSGPGGTRFTLGISIGVPVGGGAFSEPLIGRIEP